MCITENIIHYKILNGENEVEARFEITDFPKIDKVTENVKRLLLLTKPKTDESSPTIAYLRNKLEDVEKYNRELDNKMNVLQIALNKLEIEKSESIPKLNEIVRSTYSKQNKYILAIGINDYEEIPDLEFATVDARSVANLFEKHTNDMMQVMVLTDKEATRANILNSLNTIAETAELNDQVIIYFAGQGITATDGTGYILPSDSRANMLESSSISMRDVGTLFKKFKAEQTLMLVDACYSGAFDILTHRGISFDNEKTLGKLPTGKGKVVITAGTSTQAVMENADLGHGVFTYYLLKGLSGEAALHGDGIVTVTSLFNYLQLSVAKATKKFGLVQTPTMFSSEFTDFVLIAPN